MERKYDVAKGFLTTLNVNNKPVAGGLSSILSQSIEAINITNKITYEWSEYLSGVRNWSIQSSGMYVVNESSLQLIEELFLEGEPVEVSLKNGNKILKGMAIITEFPINSTYSDSNRYSIKLQGTGPLKYE